MSKKEIGMDAILESLKNIEERKVLAPELRPSREEAEEAVRTLLKWIGEDVTREGLIDTPKRVVNSYRELFSGYDLDAKEVLGRTFEEVSGYDDIVLVRDIPFHSHCEHHMVPIIGKAHVAYLPDGCVLGLSKVARTVDIFAKRLQTQENLTAQVAQTIDGALRSRGVAIMIEAEHMCMSMRGIKKHGSTTFTTAYTGEFHNNPDHQTNFMNMLRMNRDI